MKRLNKREYAIMQEAFMIGRVYNKGGEIESPADIQVNLEKKCFDVAERHGK